MYTNKTSLIKLVKYDFYGNGKRYCYFAKTKNNPDTYIIKMMFRLTENGGGNSMLARFFCENGVKDLVGLKKHITGTQVIDVSPDVGEINRSMGKRISSVLKTNDYVLLNSYRNPNFNGKARYNNTEKLD